MKSRVLLLLLSWPGALLARDPFQPPVEAPCVREVTPLNAWRLQGVIGNRDIFYAWLVHARGASLRVRPDRPFPLPPWRIASLSARKLVVVAEKSCTPQFFSFQLKGKYRDTESPVGTERPAADADHADAGHTRQ
ncbi:HofP DNA utilization family protein [[Erwinia] mediterraneensis]|uniref:HofP DNA utilization family protein n=1 Tax=[Erwinia] mediterraneensis TaxID=2161819 RepID=UPI00102F64D7|nr:HofP DNA utilization family protein [[Erwinia] mediterraneensis]